MVLDSEIFSVVAVEYEETEQASPDQEKREKTPNFFSHMF
jgi:hypothetical protein